MTRSIISDTFRFYEVMILSLSRLNGILTTVFYGDSYGNGVISSEEICALSLSVKRVCADNGSVLRNGMIYCFDETSSRRFAADGDIIDGKKVKYQKITVMGNDYRVRKIKLFDRQNVFHHAEIEVI